MRTLHFRAALAAVALGGLLAACQSAADQPAATATPAASPAASPRAAAADSASGPAMPAQLLATHQQLVADYRAMQAADSLVLADHLRALAAAKTAGIYNTSAFQELMKRHDALLARLQQGIARRQAIMDRQIALAAKQGSGQLTAAQLAQEQAALQADDQQVRQEHQRLVTEHTALMAQHLALLKKTGKA